MMSDLEFPPGLLNAIQRQNLIPFVGSGCSLQVANNLFPTWTQLLERLAEYLRSKVDPVEADIVEIYLKKKRLVKAADAAFNGLGNAAFATAMTEIFDPQRPDAAVLDVQSAILELNAPLVVTTNYDRVFEWAIEAGGQQAQVITNHNHAFLGSAFDRDTTERRKIWHLHGYVGEPQTYVLCRSQYDALYSGAQGSDDNYGAARDQLGSLLTNYTLLFLGFGLADDFVMEFILENLKRFRNSRRTSYALMKEGSCDVARLKADYNIHVIEYPDHSDLAPLLRKLTAAANDAVGPGTIPPAMELQIPEAYREWVRRQIRDFLPFGLESESGLAVSLQQVYVPPVIRLETPVLDDVAADSADQQAMAGRRELQEDRPEFELLLERLGQRSLYVSGDPGAGKSTFCRWLAQLVINDEVPKFTIQAPEEYQEFIPDELRGRLPVVIPLRDFRQHLDVASGQQTFNRNDLESRLQKWCNASDHGLEWSNLKRWLDAGRVLVVLDGVDEVPESEGNGPSAIRLRECVLSGITAAAEAWIARGNRVLVTSRPYGLAGSDVARFETAGIRKVEMQPLPTPLQELLLARWFHAVAKPEYGPDLLRKLAEFREVSELTGSPLLLTAICVIYTNGKELPKDVHELYDRIVRTALFARYPHDRRKIDPIRARLAEVAQQMHTGTLIGTPRTAPAAQIPEAELDKILGTHLEANPTSEEGILNRTDAREDLLNNSGLIRYKDHKDVEFFHLTLQDFLAAERLHHLADGLDKYLEIYDERSGIPEWRRTLGFLTANRAQATGNEGVLRLLRKLDERLVKQTDVRLSNGMALALVDGLRMRLHSNTKLVADEWPGLRAAATRAVEDGSSIRDRAELASFLGILGNPAIPSSLAVGEAWVCVPADDYRADSDKAAAISAFELSRYPITNAQYAGFVTDGYEVREYWDEEGWAWKTKYGVNKPAHWEDGKWNGPTHPVVGVSFWEAKAFCRWATACGESGNVRLPTEWEWLAAASGPNSGEYPWSGREEGPVKTYCNCLETGLGGTSPVGIFPGGAAECGACDMAGNVWEWCDSFYRVEEASNPAAGCVLRGGSWNDDADLCRSAIRVNLQPGIRDIIIGFRVARTP